MDFVELARDLAIEIEREGFYRQALIHASYVNEHPDRGLTSNERLEFLGDAVLQLVVSEYLFNEYRHLPEGDLTRVRAAIVSTPTLSRKGAELGLGHHLLLGRGEEASGGRTRLSLLENAFEAVVGAAFLDGGLERARRLVLGALSAEIAAAAQGKARRDWKTELQELAQRQGAIPEYRMIREAGPDHQKTFEVTVSLLGREAGRGTGHSKKEAEQAAARSALQVLVERWRT